MTQPFWDPTRLRPEFAAAHFDSEGFLHDLSLWTPALANDIGRCLQQRVAVGCGLRDIGGTYCAVRAWLRIDQDRLVECDRHPLTQQACSEIGCSASGKRHHDGDRA